MEILDMEFQVWDMKLQRFLPKNQHTQLKLLNFENWDNSELSKIRHHISNKVMFLQKITITKK